jgi:hypothetical protein
VIGGDLSNEVPPTLLVTLDVVLREPVRKRTLPFVRRTPGAYVEVMDQGMLSRVWQMTNRAGWAADLIVFGQSDAFAARLLEELDRRGLHAFSWVLPEASPEALARDLPRRTHVAAVLDIPERALLWGSRGVDVGWVY